MPSKRSRIHPPYKTKYRVTNWSEYDRSLISRGSLTFWVSPETLAAWRPSPLGRPGGQPKYSDLAIETVLTLRLIFHLPLRQAEGFLRSIFELLDLHLEVPDHTTISRRAQSLKVDLERCPTDGPMVLILDSSGLAIQGQGQWAAAKHGGRGKQGWRKLHLGVDEHGMIASQSMTEATGDNAATGIELIERVPGKVSWVIADAAYDVHGIYRSVEKRGAKALVMPLKTARAGPQRSPMRNRVVRWIESVGRQRWRNQSGYSYQATVENAFFRYKSIIGDRLRARSFDGQKVEALIACNVLNRMLECGAPESVAIGR